MMNPISAIGLMSSEDLLASTRELVGKSCAIEAELLLYLGEIDERQLYLERAFPSMFTFCMSEFGFSESVASNRIVVARAARRLPALVDALRSGEVHLAGLRLLVPHLTNGNCRQVLAEAAGKSKRAIEELVACLWPQPPVATIVRKLPERAVSKAPPSRSQVDPDAAAGELAASVAATPGAPVTMSQMTPLFPRREECRSVVAPLSGDTFKFQFTGPRTLRDKLRQAQDLLRHRVSDGDLAVIFEKALDALILNVKKERFAVGRKPRQQVVAIARVSSSRDIPDAIKRAVFERDSGRCAFIDESGRRCIETGGLEFDHIDGFARTRIHDVHGIRLACRAHNQHAAEQIYGKRFMEQVRQSRKDAKARRPDARSVSAPTAVSVAAAAPQAPACPGACAQQRLL